MRCLIHITSLLLCWLAISCTHIPIHEQHTVPCDAANYVLEVSNQSFAMRRVQIRVWINGELCVDDRFHIGWGVSEQHKWTAFCFGLDEGTHTIEARAYRRNELLASVEESFVLNGDKRWGVLNFYTRKGEVGRFSFSVYESQPAKL